jgi:hypothetical protein
MAEATLRNFTLNFGPQHPAAHGVLRAVKRPIQPFELQIRIVFRTFSGNVLGTRLTATNGAGHAVRLTSKPCVC